MRGSIMTALFSMIGAMNVRLEAAAQPVVSAFKPYGNAGYGRSRTGSRGSKGENRSRNHYEKHFCRQSERGGQYDRYKGQQIPRGYPGAKLARKALFGTLTKRS